MVSEKEVIPQLEKKIGFEKTVDFLEFSLPIIIDRECTLQAHISKKNWGMAQQSKHKILGSLYLYGSPKIEALLYQLDDVQAGHIDINTYQMDISQAFHCSVKHITEWLNANKSNFPKNTGNYSIH